MDTINTLLEESKDKTSSLVLHVETFSMATTFLISMATTLLSSRTMDPRSGIKMRRDAPFLSHMIPVFRERHRALLELLRQFSLHITQTTNNNQQPFSYHLYIPLFLVRFLGALFSLWFTKTKLPLSLWLPLSALLSFLLRRANLPPMQTPKQVRRARKQVLQRVPSVS